MTSPEARFERLETELDRLRPSLLERLDRIEQTLKASTPPQSKSRWAQFIAWMGAELPKFLIAFVLLAVGYWIKDSVDLSIKQRQLDLSYAKEMQGLLQNLGKKDADISQIVSTDVLLAAFGAAALPPLLRELSDTNGLRSDGAEVGIRTLGLTNPNAVCEGLPRVLESRVLQFDWMAQMKAVQILGDANCRSSVAKLSAYRAAVAAAAQGNTLAFDQIVRELPTAPKENYPKLLKAIDRSLEILRR
jgi:hypothetical protein